VKALTDYIQSTVKINNVTLPDNALYPIKRVQVVSRIGQKADSFLIELDNEDGHYKDSIKEALLVEIWADKIDGLTNKILTGKVDDREISFNEKLKNNRMLVTGVDYTGQLLNRLVAEVYKKDSKVSDAVKDVIATYFPDITTTNVTDTGATFPEDYVVDYVYAFELFQRWGELFDCDFYVDPTKDLHWFSEKSRQSLLVIGESDIAGSSSIKRGVRDVKNKVFIFGGKELVLDQQQTGISAFLNSKDYWYADELTPTRSFLNKLFIYAEKVGSPQPLRGKIIVDNNGTPQGGQELGNFQADYIESAGWYPISIDIDATHVHPIAPGVLKFWIIFEKVGDASNYYKLYTGGETTTTYAYSVDGQTWTVSSTAPKIAFKTYYGYPVVVEAEDLSSISSYSQRDFKDSDAKIRDYVVGRKIASAKLADLSILRVAGELDIIAPLTQIKAGELVIINLPDAGISNVQYKVLSVTYDIKPALSTYTLKLELGEEDPNLAAYLAELKKEELKLKQQDYALNAIINKLLSFKEPFKLADVLTITEQNTGTFLVGTARVGFADCA